MNCYDEEVHPSAGEQVQVTQPKASENPKNFRWVCYEALVVVSVTYSLVLTGVSCISGVQSSLNSDDGLGTTSLAVQTMTMIVQALLLNAFLLSKLDLKNSMLVGIVLESVYVIGNTYPTWFTLLPAAAISGFGRPLIRTAEAIYITKLASGYATTIGYDVQSTKVKFFYIYYVFYCSARVFGNVASSIILGSGMDVFDLRNVGQQMIVTSNVINGTSWNFERDTKYCGAKYCDVRTADKAVNGLSVNHVRSLVDVKPDLTKVYWLCGYSFTCLVAAFVINFLFLKSLSVVVPNVDSTLETTADNPDEDVIVNPIDYLLNTVKYWRNPRQLLIMPLSIYNGIDNAFWSADFTKAYVTCYFGIHWVGFVVAWYGLTSPITVFAVSWMNRPALRPVTFAMAFAAHMSVCIALLNWTPTVSSMPALFALSATWGVGSGLWPTIVTAFYSVLFEDNLKAAFSNYWLCDSLGAMLTYGWSNRVCTDIKIYTYMFVVSMGIVCYLFIEIPLRLRNGRQQSLVIVDDNVQPRKIHPDDEKPKVEPSPCVLQMIQKLPQ